MLHTRYYQMVPSNHGGDKASANPVKKEGSTESAPDQSNKGTKPAAPPVPVVNGIPVFHLGILERGSKPN